MKQKVFITALIAVLVVMLGSVVMADETFDWSPRLGNATPNSIEVVYKTPTEVDTYINYALKSDYDQNEEWKKTDVVTGDLFRIKLDDLKADTEYAYQVVIGDKLVTKVYTFHTAPTEEKEFTFLAYGDTRTHQKKHKLLADEMAKDETDPRLVLNVGDLVTNGKETDEWLTFSQAIKELGATTPYYSAIGNHEHNARKYYNNLALPEGGGQAGSEWYSFDYAGVHFIALDSNIMAGKINNYVQNAVEKQDKWLKSDLEANKDAKWIVVFFHHPVYTSHPDSIYPQFEEIWVPLFDKYGVDLVLTGHNHIYERVLKDGRNYIVTGGGGAPFDYKYEYEPFIENSVSIHAALLQYTRVKVTEDKLYVDVIQTHKEADDFYSLNEDKKIIDSCEIENISPSE